jgi:hypothetical protein
MFASGPEAQIGLAVLAHQAAGDQVDQANRQQHDDDDDGE